MGRGQDEADSSAALLIVYRAYDAADAQALNAVALAAFAQYQHIYTDWDELTCSVGAMAALGEQSELMVAQQPSGEIVGGVAYFGPGTTPRADFFEAEWPIIRMLVVSPSARGQGIGRGLTELCIASARRDGADVIALHTSPVMEVALSLYQKMGFKLARHVPERFGVPYAVYLMNIAEPALSESQC